MMGGLAARLSDDERAHVRMGFIRDPESPDVDLLQLNLFMGPESPGGGQTNLDPKNVPLM